MRCCVIRCGQTDADLSQKDFLPFRVLLNVGMDPNFPQKRFFFALSREKFRFPAKTMNDLAVIGSPFIRKGFWNRQGQTLQVAILKEFWKLLCPGEHVCICERP